MSEIKEKVAMMPRVPLRRKFDVHYALGIPRGDPEGIFREVNIELIGEEMKRDAEVNAAFASLKETLEAGEPAPSIADDPYSYESYDGIWNLYSSEVFSKYMLWDIDNCYFRDCGRDRFINFPKPEPRQQDDSSDDEDHDEDFQGRITVSAPDISEGASRALIGQRKRLWNPSL